MSQETKPYKRRHYFVQKEFQLKFILKFCLLVLLGAVVSTGLLFLFAQGTLTTSFEHSRISIRDTAVAIMPAVIYTNLITVALITLATMVVILFVSHKIAGPLFRFQKELTRIGEGDFTVRVHLRRKDQITDMAESLNLMVAGLNQKFRTVHDALEDLRETVLSQETAPRLVEKLNEFEHTLQTNFKV
jgi:methyl-accepting chemotaxis protein